MPASPAVYDTRDFLVAREGDALSFRHKRRPHCVRLAGREIELFQNRLARSREVFGLDDALACLWYDYASRRSKT